MKYLFRYITFGCDPEFFFSKDGRVIGAERVLPEEGLVCTAADFPSFVADGASTAVGSSKSKIVIDGVQAELNPRPNTCRANFANEVAMCFKRLAIDMAKDNHLSIDFAQTIKLTAQDMDELSDKSKKFGCMPSRNAHDGGKQSFIKVDPARYSYRSAGGHIHIGNSAGRNTPVNDAVINEVLAQPERLVKILDIIVGNTAVLLDRDPGNVERRKVYGKAGEFRTPPHGVEYRTLSNFWLRNSTLMSLVLGLTRFAVIVVADNKDDEFLKCVDLKKVAKAINTNDYKLALKNFEAIEHLFPEEGWSSDYPITQTSLQAFKHFAKTGLDHWFVDTPMQHWLGLNDGHYTGFEAFLRDRVRLELPDVDDHS